MLVLSLPGFGFWYSKPKLQHLQKFCLFVCLTCLPVLMSWMNFGKKYSIFPGHPRLATTDGGGGGGGWEGLLRRNVQRLPLSWVGEDLVRFALELGWRWEGWGWLLGCGAWQTSPCDSNIDLPLPEDHTFCQCLPLSFTVWYILKYAVSHQEVDQRSLFPILQGTHFFLLSLMSTRTISVSLSISLPNLAQWVTWQVLWKYLLWMVRMTASFGSGKKIISKTIKEVMLLWFGRKDNLGLAKGKGKGRNSFYLERLIFWNPGWPRVLNYVSLGLGSFSVLMTRTLPLPAPLSPTAIRYKVLVNVWALSRSFLSYPALVSAVIIYRQTGD